MAAEVRVLDQAEAEGHLGELAEILVDAVNGGASVNFMLPFGVEEARRYWQGVPAAIAAGHTVLFGAFQDGRLDGTVQLQPAPQPNQPHRADIAKMLVHSRSRRQGLARRLLHAAEAEAAARGRFLLTLDTLADTPAERLYLSLGYTLAGRIPDYAALPAGGLRPTSLFYRRLGPVTA